MADIIIIGGGAAGCFAAVTAAELGSDVLVLEPGRLMHKLSITGKGRCNLTNNSDIETFMRNIKTNPQFMRGALSRFPPQDTMSFFEGLGVSLKTERGNRVFPASDRAGDIVNALSARMKTLSVRVINDRAAAVTTELSAVTGVIGERGAYSAQKIIIATGGLSYPKTGSTGDGYKLAAALGHTIKPCKAALVPVETHEDVSELAGLTLRNVKLSAGEYCGQGEIRSSNLFAEQGEILFTHFGISGPLALTASCYINQSPAAACRLSIDLKPALTHEKLDARILRDFAENKNKQIANIMGLLVPKKLILPVLFRAYIPPGKQVNAVTAAERQRLIAALKGFALTFKALRPVDEAVITDGGVDTREISPRTMESKLIRGLYFAGEVIDIAAFTGGFNLQLAFSTAAAAARKG